MGSNQQENGMIGDIEQLLAFGRIGLETGYYEQAREDYERVLELDASNQEAIEGLARIDEILGTLCIIIITQEVMMALYGEKLGGLGRRSARLLTTLAGRDRRIFTTEDAVEILGGRRNSAIKLLHDLVEGGWIERLEKGKYSIIPLAAGPERAYSHHAFLVASHLIDPYYISYWSSLHYHGFTE